jgi:uncharacterized protein YbaA (DUF1428 family)
MNNSDVIEKKENGQKGNYIVMFIYRVPKKNHEALIRLGKQVNDTFNKVGVLRSEVFRLSKTEDMMGFTNVSKIVSTSNDQEEEEVLLETQTYRDHKHLAEVGALMEKDKSAIMLYQQFINLIVPNSCIFGEFSRINM